MGTSVSCFPAPKLETFIHGKQHLGMGSCKCASLHWVDKKEVGKSTYRTNHQQTGDSQQQTWDYGSLSKPEKLKEVLESNLFPKSQSQQQVPCSPVNIMDKWSRQLHPTQISRKTFQGRRRKFPEPTTMPKPLTQILAEEVKDNDSTFEFSARNAPKSLNTERFLFSTPVKIEAKIDIAPSQTEKLCSSGGLSGVIQTCQNPPLSSLWCMQFERQFFPWSVVSEESSDEGFEKADADYADKRIVDDDVSTLYEFKEASEYTIAISSADSDASSTYELTGNEILTDYKSYGYCSIDGNGFEEKVHVKILKDLSLALLLRAGIKPEENPALFGLDPSLNLQRVYDHGGDLWVISQHDVDITLKDFLGECREVPFCVKIYITSELIKKFKFLHGQGIFMNNFGSASIVLTRDGRICVSDFLESALQKLKSLLVVGKKQLGALNWNPLSTDRQRRKDVYRLGQVIGKLMVGKKFQLWVQNGSDIELMLRSETVPNPIVKVICRCLKSREETISINDISSIASAYFIRLDVSSGRSRLQECIGKK